MNQKSLHPAEIANIKADTEMKLLNSQKLRREIVYYPFAMATGLIMAVGTGLTIILKLIGKL